MSGQGISQFIPLILIFIIFYFFLIRPQQKRVKDHKTMVENLKRGDEVITSGGIIGTVERVMEDDRIEVLISENTKVEIIRSTITSLLKKEEIMIETLDLYEFFKRISTLEKTKENEFRKIVGIRLIDCEKEMKIDMDKLKEFAEILEKFIKFVREYISS